VKNFVWTSDIHLDRMDKLEYRELKEWIVEKNPDAVVLSGDIAEADSVVDYLIDFDCAFQRPIYFVLGNHDFFNGSYKNVRNAIRSVVKKHENLKWLSDMDVVSLNDSSALIGHEGWGDARFGNFHINGPVPRDFILIEDLVRLKPEEYVEKLNRLGDISAEHIGRVLRQAVKDFEKIFLITHWPPFQEACVDKDLRICDEQKLTFDTCKVVGDVIKKIMQENLENQLTVLCGHTHQKHEIQVLANLKVQVKDSGYGVFYDPTLIQL